MFADALPDLPIRGETGIDVFDRIDLPGHRRSRFRCLGTVAADGTAQPWEAGVDPARLTRAAARLPAALPLDLADATGFPAPAADALELFLRIDFLRARTLAGQMLDRFAAALARDPAAAVADPGPFAAQVAQAYDFNRIAAGIALARAALPALPATPALADGHGFALRMLGDLALRGGEAGLALACFEAAIGAGDNPHRRARARAAAQALGDPATIARHAPPTGAAA